MIFIPGNVPSSKNSKIACSKGVFMSPQVRHYLQFIGVKKYRKNEAEDYKKRINLFRLSVGEEFSGIKYPVILGLHFVRKSKHKFDFNNAAQIICDLLAAHQFIQDDNMDCLIPMPFKIDGKWYSYNKEKPGVYIKVMDDIY